MIQIYKNKKIKLIFFKKEAFFYLFYLDVIRLHIEIKIKLKFSLNLENDFRMKINVWRCSLLNDQTEWWLDEAYDEYFDTCWSCVHHIKRVWWVLSILKYSYQIFTHTHTIHPKYTPSRRQSEIVQTCFS